MITDKVVKNIPAFECLLKIFNFITSKTASDTPHTLEIGLFSNMKEIIMAHPCNYFILGSTDAVPMFLECLGEYDASTQKGVLELLTYILETLNFTPIKEMIVLSLHFHSNSVINICNNTGY